MNNKQSTTTNKLNKMNKIKLVTIMAVIGFAALASRAAAPIGVDIVTVKGTLLLQTNNTEKGSTTEYHVQKVKVTTKDVLNLIAHEFTSVSGITNTGSKLAVIQFYDGQFEVLDTNNNVILADASENIDADDDYELYLSHTNDVNTGTDSDTKYSETATAVSAFSYEDATDLSFATVNGLATVKDQSNNDLNDTQSFTFSGSGDASVQGTPAIFIGSLSGQGKDVGL